MFLRHIKFGGTLLLFFVAVSSTTPPDVSTLDLKTLCAQLIHIATTRYLADPIPESNNSTASRLRASYVDYSFGSAFDLPSSNQSNSISSFTSFDALTPPALVAALHPNFALYTSVEKSTALYTLPIHAVDSIHGSNYFFDTALYPQSLNVAATFNLTHAFAQGLSSCASTYSSSLGSVRWIFSPLFGVSSSPAWARVYETFGESSSVVAQMSQSFVAGAASTNLCATTAKHYLGYADNQGRDRGVSRSATRDRKVWNANLLNSKTQPKATTVMTSYTQSNGEYSVNFDRKELGDLRRYFDGIVVTDFDEIWNSINWHRNAKNLKDALQSFYSFDGVDLLMAPYDNGTIVDAMVELVEEGKIDRKLLERKVSRLFKLKQQLLEDDFAAILTNSAPPTPASFDVQADREAAYEAALESVTLLKNDGDVLPLQDPTIILTGPTANYLPSMVGGWAFHWQGPTDNDDPGFSTTTPNNKATLLEGLQNQFADVMFKPFEFDTTESDVSARIDSVASTCTPESHIVIAVGEQPYTEKPGDVRDAHLPNRQLRLVREIRTNCPSSKIIVVYFGGRARLLGDIVDNCDAFIAAFLPGVAGGTAVAAVLSGSHNPTGKLPVTWEKFNDGAGRFDSKVSDLCTGNQKEDKNGAGDNFPNYSYEACATEFDFGYGLSYTDFEFTTSDSNSNSTIIVEEGPKGSHNFTVSVKNVGERAGSTVSMMFYQTLVRKGATPSRKELFSFARTKVLEPGEEQVLIHELTADDFLFASPESSPRLILENDMESLVVHGLEDCRADINNPGCLTSRVKLKPTNPNQACVHACAAWEMGCSLVFGETFRCSDLCNDEWDWNYVDCVWGAVSKSEAGSGCNALLNHCKNVFNTPNDDDAVGENIGKKITPDDTENLVITALVSMVVGTIAGIFIAGGCRADKRTNHHNAIGRGSSFSGTERRDSTLTTLEGDFEDEEILGGEDNDDENDRNVLFADQSLESMQMTRMNTSSSVII